MLTRFRTIASRARFMIERRRLDEDMRQEIDAHIESLAEGYRRQGMSADEAYLAARRQFGNIALLRQDIREMNRIPWIEHTIQEARYAVRLLWRAKAFTTAAVLTLALGIAATTVMFALIQGVLLRPLPVQEQDRLILSWREAPTAGSAFYPFGDVEIEAVARDSQLLESAAGVTRNGVGRAVVSDGSTSSYANVGLITGGFFEVLGAQALLGRRFTLADDRERCGACRGHQPRLLAASLRRRAGCRRPADNHQRTAIASSSVSCLPISTTRAASRSGGRRDRFRLMVRSVSRHSARSI